MENTSGQPDTNYTAELRSLTYFDFNADSLEDNQIWEAWLYLASAIQVGVIFVQRHVFRYQD